MRDDGFKDDGRGDERPGIVRDLLGRADSVLSGMQAVPSPSPIDPEHEDRAQRIASARGYIEMARSVLRA